jgi:putative ABC transport system ATP-binding protein
MSNHTQDSGKPVVKLSGVAQSFTVGDETVNVIHGADFEIKPGSFNILYGQSGSGKSTLLNILSGLQRPTKGSVVFNGKDIYNLRSDDLAFFRANEIGIVYQQNYWVNSLNVVENVSMPLYLQGYRKAEAEAEALKMLKRINMDSYAKKYPTLLSGGEQQRVAMARAIVNSPSVVIADEPTGNLDNTNGDMIMDFLVNYQAVLGHTIILVTHNMEYLTLADHLLNIQDGDVRDMKGKNISDTTESLIRSMRERIDHFAVNKKDKTSDAKKS